MATSVSYAAGSAAGVSLGNKLSLTQWKSPAAPMDLLGSGPAIEQMQNQRGLCWSPWLGKVHRIQQQILPLSQSLSQAWSTPWAASPLPSSASSPTTTPLPWKASPLANSDTYLWLRQNWVLLVLPQCWRYEHIACARAHKFELLIMFIHFSCCDHYSNQKSYLLFSKFWSH